ncbi:hypothetical protein BTM409_18770 [Helicobacter pylori]
MLRIFLVTAMKEKGLWVLKLNLKKSFQKDFDKLLLNGFDDSVLNEVILRKNHYPHNFKIMP